MINVPVVAVTLLAAWVLVGDSCDPDAAPADPVGAALSIAGLLVLVGASIEVPERGWADGFTLAGFAAAAALLGAFIAWELRASHPMLEVGVFADPRFSAASLSVALVFFAMTGVLFVLIQHLQFVLGYTPLQAGYRLLPIATVMAAAPLSARPVDAIGTKAAVVGGMLLNALALPRRGWARPSTPPSGRSAARSAWPCSEASCRPDTPPRSRPRSRASPPRPRSPHAARLGRPPRSPPGWEPRERRCWSRRGRRSWPGWARRCWSG